MKSWVAYTAGSCVLFSVAAVGGAISCASTSHEGQELADGAWVGGDAGDGGPGIVLAQDGEGTLGLESGGQPQGTGNCTALKRVCSSSCPDFPAAPLFDGPSDGGAPAAPANAASLFAGSDGTGPGPCIVEPVAGTLIPQNWLRPRFRVIPAAGQNVFQITLSSKRQANSYVVYTASDTWTMPKKDWDGLRGDSWGDEVTVTIRGVSSSGGTPTSSASSFTIAPASAGGSMIYWAATGDQNGLSWLEGFAPGDESVATTLEVSQVKLSNFRDQGGNLMPDGGAAECIGCHTAPPDGNSVTFLDFYPWPGAAALVNPDGGGGTGAVPSWLTGMGVTALSMPWLGVATFSKADWATEQVAVTSYGCAQPTVGIPSTYPWASGPSCSDQANSSLAWINLAVSGGVPEASSGYNLGEDIMANFGTSSAAFGFLERTGDSRGVEFPNWSHDGTTIVYVSTNAGKDGRIGLSSQDAGGGQFAPTAADLYTVPFNARKGGAATPVQGASDPTAYEYYPAFSEDDKLLAFDRASTYNATRGLYYNASSEVYVIPASGAASPTRVAANDPPACQGTLGSPGVTNSWPKWSPDVETCDDGNTYYWLVFSSTREGIPFDNPNGANFKNGGSPDGPTSQLYITGVTVSGGTIATHPALFIWNQGMKSASFGGNAQSNHTPIWEYVTIPLPPPPMQPK